MGGEVLVGLKSILRYLEDGRSKCILCRQSTANPVICNDGVGICKACYDRIMKSRATDYYDTGGDIRRLFAPFEYKNELREAIFEFKFGGSYAYGDIFAGLVYDALPPYYLYTDYDMLVPVPLHFERLNSRGYNQSELLAEGLSRRIGIPAVTDVLFRTRNTMHQMALSRGLRERNVSGAFYAAGKEVSGKRILLIDDIYTVGATARACAKELLCKGAAEVSVIAVSENFYKSNTNQPTVRIPTVLK